MVDGILQVPCGVPHGSFVRIRSTQLNQIDALLKIQFE